MKKKLSAKEYLEQLADIDVIINQDIERLSVMRQSALGVKSFDYSKEKVQTSASDRLCEDVTNIVTLNEYINNEIDRFVDTKETIICQIRDLHNAVYNQILYKMYVEFKSMKQCSFEMGKSYSYVKKYHNEALKAFEETYPDLYYV